MILTSYGCYGWEGLLQVERSKVKGQAITQGSYRACSKSDDLVSVVRVVSVRDLLHALIQNPLELPYRFYEQDRKPKIDRIRLNMYFVIH